MDGMAEQPTLRSQAERPTRPQVVIIGAGFGGLSAALKLRHIDADVVVVDRRNHHLFQPLLYQVATAGLSPADIAAPIRGILGRQANTRVVLGAVTGIDWEGHAVLIGERRISYDQLVIATGARDAYFGHDDWAMVTSPLKTIEEATTMRRRILIAFEHAEDTEDANERRQLLTFVIIGGGPTGVELAGALAELARMALARDFRHIDPENRADHPDRSWAAGLGDISAATVALCRPGVATPRGRSPGWGGGDRLRQRRRESRR
jgi:NADH:ubiquinone reductase (H+-translocating)